MKVIQPNCRARFTAQDVDFVLSVLGRKLGAAECLVRLLADDESRDLILDDEDLFKALLERAGCLSVSTHFYFYVLVRHVFRQADIADREVADYVAMLLAEFAREDPAHCTVAGQAKPLKDLFEMLIALDAAGDDRTRFCIRAHIGNWSLFLAGVFPDRIRVRAESRGFPDLKYYEGMGRTQYQVASDDRMARRYEVGNILGTLAERFQAARLALNDISERLFSFGDATGPWEVLLRKGGA